MAQHPQKPDTLAAPDTGSATPQQAVTENPWQQLRQLTSARIALGRTGISLPTEAQLAFQYAHAQARDAVHLPFDHADLRAQLQQRQRTSLLLHSAAGDRHTYLQRPDLGRRLDNASCAQLREWTQTNPGGVDLAIVIADGLSALAVHRHSLPFLARIEEQAVAEGWSLGPIMLVEQGRVAVADEVGELLGAKMVVILIGERPGLSSPDSLGVYFTYAPKVGLTDAYRNCISNVRLEGLSYAMASHRLLYLMREACRRQLSGVDLKDQAQAQSLDCDPAANMASNFLLADGTKQPADE
jgi:ethanolamine ammonia-lyase small subunit